MLSSSLRTSLSSTTLIFDHREYWFKSRIQLNSASVKVGFTDITVSILSQGNRACESRKGLMGTIAQFGHLQEEEILHQTGPCPQGELVPRGLLLLYIVIIIIQFVKQKRPSSKNTLVSFE